MKALAIFGSSVYSPLKSRDIDLIVVVDRLKDIKEKKQLEIEIAQSIRSKKFSKPIDILVFDIEMLKENAKPGGVASGLIMGYTTLYDEIGLQNIVEEVLEEVAEEEGYTIIKRNRKINLSSLAKTRKLMKRDNKKIAYPRPKHPNLL